MGWEDLDIQKEGGRLGVIDFQKEEMALILFAHSVSKRGKLRELAGNKAGLDTWHCILKNLNNKFILCHHYTEGLAVTKQEQQDQKYG